MHTFKKYILLLFINNDAASVLHWIYALDPFVSDDEMFTIGYINILTNN